MFTLIAVDFVSFGRALLFLVLLSVAFVSLFCSRVLLSVALFICELLLWVSFDRALLSRVLLPVSLFVC